METKQGPRGPRTAGTHTILHLPEATALEEPAKPESKSTKQEDKRRRKQGD